MWQKASHLVQNRGIHKENATAENIPLDLHKSIMESSNTNLSFINDSHTDMDSKITEWLANEEASLEKVPMNFFDNQQQDITSKVNTST